MLRQAQVRLLAAFLGGVLVGAAGLALLAGRGPAAEAADQQGQAQPREAPQVGRYQPYKLDDPNTFGGLLDTTTGKLWRLQSIPNPQPKGPTVWKWVPFADAPN
ncbi:MAG TPA: hypothetical protein VKE74_24580 [Gemmataceae bacterium]|nr:hypothetical protein [Gemmataceae bacterium]